MIKLAQSRGGQRAKFIGGVDAAALPPELRCASFDLAYSFHCLHWIPASAFPDVMGGFASALRHSGRLVVTMHGGNSMQPLMDEIIACLSESGYDPTTAWKGLTRFSAAELETVLSDAGFHPPDDAAHMVRLVPFRPSDGGTVMHGVSGVRARIEGAWGPMLTVPPPDGLWAEVAGRYARRHGVNDEIAGDVPLRCEVLHVDAVRTV